MSQKTPVSGTVVAVGSGNSVKIGNQWYSLSSKGDGRMPSVGQTVTFDGYGEKQNIFYRFSVAGEGATSNGNGGHSAPAHSSGPDPLAAAGVRVSKDVALLAAAALLAGSDDTVEGLVERTKLVAGMFEKFLEGGL